MKNLFNTIAGKAKVVGRHVVIVYILGLIVFAALCIALAIYNLVITKLFF